MAMEFVEGRTLREHIRSHDRLDPLEAIAITLHVAEGLKYAWNKSRMIHRDIKPDNVFLSQSGEVLVGDLGLAKNTGGTNTEMTSTGMMLGSPHYISPEQATAVKDIDFRADIYSLGCTLFQMLTGRTAYQGDSSMVLIMKHVNDPTPDIFEALPECPRKLGVMVGRMMAKNRDDRPASYDELIAGLWEANENLSGNTEIGRPPATPALPPTAVGRVAAVPTVAAVTLDGKSVIGDRRLVTGGAVAVGVALLAGLLWWSPWKTSSTSKSITNHQLLITSYQSPVTNLQSPPPLGNVFTNSVGAEMVYIPPGEFMMGSTKEEKEWAVEKTRTTAIIENEGGAPRKATIKQGFWMGRTEITVGQWKQFVNETGYVTDGEKKGESDVYQGQWQPFAPMKGKNWRDPHFGFEPQDNHPVCCISWNDAITFCKWLDGREQRAGRLTHGYAVRLPTEVEWEYACRAGTQTKFWWGESPQDGKGRLNCDGKDDGYEFVAPVDSFGVRGRNRFGLADMLGNIYEWCLEERGVSQASGVGVGNIGGRIARGGSFNGGPTFCRCAYRGLRLKPSHSASLNGFRVVVGEDARGDSNAASAPLSSTLKESGILAPPETRVPALTTNPKVGEVYTLPLGSNVTMELMGLPPGEFMLGSTKEEQAWAVAEGLKEELAKREGKAPRKAVIKQGFWMSRTEVTVGQWKQFVKETGFITDGERNGASFTARGSGQNMGMAKGANWKDPNFGFKIEGHFPVCCISWDDAMAFCRWLTERERKAGRLPASQVVRLPTEAEWEYACRAGTQTKFWWGEAKEDGAGRLNLRGTEDGFEFTSPVDSYGARGRNKFGLADVLGNVYEWCLDAYDVTQAREELWTGNPSARVLRGGAFNDASFYCRCADRNSRTPSYSSGQFGFRVVVGIDIAGGSKATSVQTPSATKAK
jgi:formylglycine-generating enzyme required for sulfatase activity